MAQGDKAAAMAIIDQTLDELSVDLLDYSTDELESLKNLLEDFLATGVTTEELTEDGFTLSNDDAPELEEGEEEEF